MSKVDRKLLQDVEYLSLRDKNNGNISRFFIPHDTIIGASGFKNADLTVLGDLIVCGSIQGTGSMQGTGSSSQTGSLPNDVFFLVLSGTSSLPNARTLSTGSNVSFRDSGGGLAITQSPTDFRNSLFGKAIVFDPTTGIPDRLPFLSSTFLSSSTDGLLTSGEWSYEAYYRFDEDVDHPATQSLARLHVTGTDTPSRNHGIITNLVLTDASTPVLDLYVGTSTGSSVPYEKITLEGADVMDGGSWHVSFGRRSSSSILTGSYYVWAARHSASASSYLYVTGNYGDYQSTINTVTSSYNASGSFLCIGSQSFYEGGSLFLNDPSVPSNARVSMFSGELTRARFSTLNLTTNELLDHARGGQALTVNAAAAGSTGRIQYYNDGVFGSSTNLRWNDAASLLDVEGQVKSQNLTSFYRSDSLGAPYSQISPVQIFMRRVIHFFPVNGALSMTGGNGILIFRNLYGFGGFAGQDHGPNGKPFIMSTTLSSFEPAGFYGNTTYSYTRPAVNPVMRTMIRTYSTVSSNVNMTLGFRQNNAAGSDTDRPQPFKYAYLQFFTGSNGTSTDSATSVNGSAGSQPIRADSYWTMVTSGTFTTQSINVTNVPVLANTDYYVELALTSGSMFRVNLEGGGYSGSFEMGSGISSTTDLGVEIFGRPVVNVGARTRGIGIYFIQLED